ncbi:MAG: hypothetical protein ACRENL_11545 [Candidatus Dormibacteria bacterium]
MRRRRPHRLTGSVRRLVAAAVLAVCGAAAVVTAVSAAGVGVSVGPGGVSRDGLTATAPLLSSSGLQINLPPLPTINLPSLSLPPLLPHPTPTPTLTLPPLPVSLPPLPTLPSLLGPTPTPVIPAPVVPGNGSGPPPGPPGTIGPGSTLTGPTSGNGTPLAGNGATGSTTPGFAGFSAAGSAATSSLAPPQLAELSLSPPPAVEQLTPIAGISFGQAPFLWPLFLGLDLIAAAVAFAVLRRTLSTTPGAD